MMKTLDTLMLVINHTHCCWLQFISVDLQKLSRSRGLFDQSAVLLADCVVKVAMPLRIFYDKSLEGYYVAHHIPPYGYVAE